MPPLQLGLYVVEDNATFYALPKAETVQKGAEDAAPGFAPVINDYDWVLMYQI